MFDKAGELPSRSDLGPSMFSYSTGGPVEGRKESGGIIAECDQCPKEVLGGFLR
jgi:hypothetical protein